MNREITAEEFRPKKMSQPYMLCKSRPANNEAFISYVSPQDEFEAFIDPKLLKQISEESESASPFETIGLLAGRVWRDEKGPYTLVLAASSATREQIEATTSHVRISGNEMSELREKLEVANPALEVIGWYHSHPRFTPYYSSEDKTEQSTWSDPNHIGIVVSGLMGEDAYGVYRGPNATRLVLRTEATFAQHAGNNVFQPVRPKPTPSGPKIIPEPARRFIENNQPQPETDVSRNLPRRNPTTNFLTGGEARFPLSVKLVILAVVIAFIAAIACILWMSHRFGTVEGELKRLSGAPSSDGKNGSPATANTPPSSEPVQKDSDNAQQKSTLNQAGAGRVEPETRVTKPRRNNRGRTNNQPKNEGANKAQKTKAETKPETGKAQNDKKAAAPGAKPNKDRASNQ